MLITASLLGRPLSMLSQHPEVSKEGLEVQPATWATINPALQGNRGEPGEIQCLVDEEVRGVYPQQLSPQTQAGDDRLPSNEDPHPS